ncbi:ATPase [Qipengyuania vesicularis]|uniref:ATPase n=1 Tax=Qipengyuania vesicularis TaxID=2867232 RepID=UPI001C881F9E|nr:ATPase [Qipengyuania vesicularis]MBX7526875.1 ATPase [Qipengyuania vesicularis]
MAKRSHITVVEGETAPTAAEEDTLVLENTMAEEPVAEEEPVYEEWYEEEIERPSRGWITPSLSLLAIAVWTGFYFWANRTDILAGGTAQAWASWIVSWSVPVLLVLAVWMLVQRNSTREALRYGEVARSLSEESALLERRLVTVNRELSLAREFLGNQSRDLEYLGRSASEKISEHADRLQGLIHDNGQQVDAIAGTSTAALENMEKLRDNLPVIANSARDVSNQIGGVGRTAQDQLGALVAGFERLNEFGEASERQVGSLRKRVDEAIMAFTEQANELETVTAERFAALAEGSNVIRNDLQAQEIEALSALRARSMALRTELAETHASASAEEEQLVAAMRGRIASLRDEAAQIAASVREGEDIALGAWSNQIDALKTRLEETLAQIREVDEKAMESANAKLQTLFSEATDIDARITERNRQFEEETLRRTGALTEAQDELAASLEARMAALDEAITERREAQRAQLAAMAEEGEALGGRIAQLGETFGSIAAQGHEAKEALAGGIDALVGQLRNSREALDGTDQEIVRLTDASVRLLELIQASAKHSSQELPRAMVASEERLAEIEKRANDVHALLENARVSGELLNEGMSEIEARTHAAMEGFGSFNTDFEGSSSRQIETVEGLRANLAALANDSNEFAAQVQGELREAIAALEEKARVALADIESEQAGRIQRIADSIGERSTRAIDEALADKTQNALAQLDEERARSNQATRDMTQHLRDQLGRLNELTVNLESRIAHAREQAIEEVDHDFARRVALITESLNSNSIDIAKALSSEVTDTAWASYLRGDRGIFTRRAVRLLDNAEAREIAELYDNDSDFREHVNRYIHDFEAMLRTLLSTRDGNAVSVTLLSSDMGKLYVVLAQALERLRQ